MIIREMKPEDAENISAMVIRTLRTSNAKDYPQDIIVELAARHTPAFILDQARERHFLVAEEDGRICGCGAYKLCGNRCILSTIFVDPLFQGHGTGRRIVEALEQDAARHGAAWAELHASITGLAFYLHLGYTGKDGILEMDGDMLYFLEKQLSGP